MKKILIIFTIAALSGISFFCAKNVKEGFYGDDAFRLTGYGKDVSDGKNQLTREKRACEAALLDAQGRMVSRMAEAGIESVKGKIDRKVYEESIAVKFTGIIKNGRVISESYDDSTKECYVLYEISEKDLKLKVINAAKK